MTIAGMRVRITGLGGRRSPCNFLIVFNVWFCGLLFSFTQAVIGIIARIAAHVVRMRMTIAGIRMRITGLGGQRIHGGFVITPMAGSQNPSCVYRKNTKRGGRRG